MELIRETVNIGETALKGCTQVMTDGDICIPDIKPDMLKILQVDASACVTDTEVTDGRINISGRICVTALYVPDRDEEKVRSADAVFEFSQRVENSKIKAGMNSAIFANVERLEFSALNSRKLHVKAIVSLEYEAADIHELAIASGTESESAEVKCESFNISGITAMGKSGFIVKETIEIPSSQNPINEILKTDIKISDTEYKAIDGKVVIKGTACICVLYTDTECNIEFTEAEIPFTEVADMENVSEDSFCDIDYSVMSVSGTVSEDSDGDRKVINIEAEISASIKACGSREIEVLCDCYEPYRKTDIKKSEMTVEEITERPSMQNTMRETVDFSSEAAEITGVYNVVARAAAEQTTLGNGKLVCTGKIEAYILYLSDSREHPVCSVKREFPFSYSMDCGADCEGADCEVKAEIKHVSYNLNAAGELELRCITSLNANIIKRRRIDVIDEISDEERPKRGGIIVYFVQSGDNLWNTAKKYAVPQQEIIRLNNLEDEELTQGMKLFIPVCR